ncbi:spindle pole body interacting protein [Fomitiporia mediterranea MF3/22]|uniref:spindle pole body interacting protein n=1 Tax=Fomitiporia mediterranea (strain MF3/22) TaxID=694068 RepID=UPI0004407F24|nr:spindle pole body interacting protein [Fomitiporia mediterranea MF3/22]EJC99276.1 spindle pole body interacting protein [Fomitiporia mediterranea MF3/22]
MSGTTSMEHCAFVLLAEFDIDRGAQLTYQFPQPLGTDEGLLAHQMLPDGADRQLEDWTIFFLNQTPFNRIEPVLALESSSSRSIKGDSTASLGQAGEGDGVGVGDGKEGDGEEEEGSELLYVLNLVRTKLDATARRGAEVKAMAICTRHPFIQIFKPVLLMALHDYFSDPSQECLARLFDAVNAMDISGAPTLTRDEKLIMRVTERKDIFMEKFASPPPSQNQPQSQSAGSKRPSQGSTHAAHRERERERERGERDRDTLVMHQGEGGSRSSFEGGKTQSQSQSQSRSRADSLKSHKSAAASESSGPASYASGAAWAGAGEDGVLALDGLHITTTTTSNSNNNNSNGNDSHSRDRAQSQITPQPTQTQTQTQRGRRSVDSNSTSSHARRDEYAAIPLVDVNARAPKDTHFYTTSIVYRGHTLPIKMPLATFPEEVGDYSLISLIQTFNSPSTSISGPQHPHLHTNGDRTHPIILLFNALITNKRVIFLGYQRPAGQVASVVLAACALGSGCGAVLRGFIARAFPYANLTNRDEWEKIPGYIAGVTNPIFEQAGEWDLLCDISTGRMVVHKDIHINWPVGSLPSSSAPPPGTGGITRVGTLRGEPSLGMGGVGGSEEEVGRMSMSTQVNAAPIASVKADYSGKADSPDNIFMDDIINAIQYHFGETLVRARFTEYVLRFVRLVARYEEEYLGGTTKIGFPTVSFDAYAYPTVQLGSGMIFQDDVSVGRELVANARRIEGWRRTEMYRFYLSDFQNALQTRAIQGFDVLHQIVRLKTAKSISDTEVELIMRSLAENVQTYDQVVELLSLLPQYLGGLLPLTFGLFHQQETIRNLTVELLTTLRAFPIGVQFLQGLNHFHRYAFVRQAHTRETKILRDAERQHTNQHNHTNNHNHSHNSNHGNYANNSHHTSNTNNNVNTNHTNHTNHVNHMNHNTLLSPPLPNLAAWTPTNRSESSLGGVA